MNNLRKELDDIIINIIQLPRGVTVSHEDYRRAVLDAIINSLPSPEKNSPNSHEGAYIEGRNHTLHEIKGILESAKGDR